MCKSSFDNGKMGCIDPSGCNKKEHCTSDKCGFKQIWSNGLRQELLDAQGDLKPGMSPAWLKTMKWERFKTEKPPEGSTDQKETLRSDRHGTIIDFFDEFEPVMDRYAYHRCLSTCIAYQSGNLDGQSTGTSWSELGIRISSLSGMRSLAC